MHLGRLLDVAEHFGPQQAQVPRKFDESWVARLKEYFAEDPRLNELDIQVEFFENRLLLRGDVSSDSRRELVASIAHEVAQGCENENQIRVLSVREPAEVEEIG